MKVLLVQYTAEAAYLGGPTTRVPRLLAELRRAGVSAELYIPKDCYSRIDRRRADVIHVFNSWPSKNALHALFRARETGARVVFSPILLDATGAEIWQTEIPELAARGFGPDAASLEHEIAARGRRLEALKAVPFPPHGSPAYRETLSDLKIMLSLPDRIISLSDFERRLIHAVSGRESATTVVRNPVDSSDCGLGDPRLFEEHYGVRDYLLVIARVEARKNQLLLAHALRGSPIPLVLLGGDADSPYAGLIRKLESTRTLLTGRIERSSPLFRSALAGARAFALPSWAEGAPLSALEASAAGKQLILSSFSGEHEYFGEQAAYVRPYDIPGMRSTLQAIWDRPFSEAASLALRSFTERHYSWQHHVDSTLRVYARALDDAEPRPEPWPLRKRVFVELALLHHEGRSSALAAGIRGLRRRYRRLLGRARPVQRE